MHSADLHASDKICLECNREFTGIISNCPHDNSVLFKKIQDPLIGTLLGSYEIQSVLGQGGMGVVYKARHTLMERTAALKMLHSQLVSDSTSVMRFKQESKAASRIEHPNVITIYEFGISPSGQPYIVMEYLEGRSLADYIKKDGQVSVERAVHILTQACDALDHAHKQGVIHRDLKPTNIVLINYDNDADFVKVVDFGVAKLLGTGAEGQRLTQAGEVCGSPVYMSPEQCKGEDLDRRSDIYSMGIVIYETLTGKLPILGRTMVDTMTKHISEMPLPFSEARPDLYIPERLEAVVFKALAKEPHLRQQSMAELRDDLEMAIPRPGRSQVLRTQPIEERQPEKSSSKTGLVAGIAAAVVVACGVGAYVFSSSKSPEPKPAVVTPAPAAVAPAQPVVPPPASANSSSSATGASPAAVTASARPAKPVEPATKPAEPATRPAKPASHVVTHSTPKIVPRKPAVARAPQQERTAPVAKKPKADPFSSLKDDLSPGLRGH